MFDGFSWAAMGVMIGLIALIVTLAGLWLRAALGKLRLSVKADIGDSEQKLVKKIGETDLRVAQLEAHSDRQFGAIRVDLAQINVRLKSLEDQVSPVFGQLVETGLETTPAANGSAKHAALSGESTVEP